MIINLNGHCDQKLNESRFQQIEEKVLKISNLESSVTEPHNTDSTLLSGKSHPSLPAPVAFSSERLPKESTACASSPDVKMRSDSVASNKRSRVEDNELSDSDIEFIQPRYNIRKADKRLKHSPDNKLPFNKVRFSK